MRKKKHDDQLPCLTRAPDKNIPYARLKADMIESPQFRALSKWAIIIYAAGVARTKGKLDFNFPRSEQKRAGIPTASFTRGKNELVQAGFITERKYYKQESVYTLSSEWMRREPIREKRKNKNNFKV